MQMCYNKSYQDKFDEMLKEHFFNTYTFNKFVVLFQKGVYPYEYMNDWEMFNETPFWHFDILTFTSIWKILMVQIMCTQK